MIVLIKPPRTGRQGLHAALNAALGADAVGWLGRNVTRQDLRDGLPGRRLAILVGPIDIADARALPGVERLTTILPEPHAIAMAEWCAAREKPDHPRHAIAHTLSIDELIATQHPFAERLSNVMTRALTPRGTTSSARTALATLETHRVLVGLSARPKAYAHALAKALDLPGEALPARPFETEKRPGPRGEALRALKRANAMDQTLVDTVRERLDPVRHVYDTLDGVAG